MNKGEFQFDGDRSELPEVRMRLWGDFTVTDHLGDLITPRGRKSRALLAWLALHPGRPISRERLCGLLWGDRGEEQARASLRQALFELKPFTAGPGPLLRVDRAHITLDPVRLETDLDQLAAAAADNDQTILARLRPDHDERFLANLDDIDSGFDDWLRIERTRQRDRLESLLNTPLMPRAQATPPAAAPVLPAPADAAPALRRRSLPWHIWLCLLFFGLAVVGGVAAWRPFGGPGAWRPWQSAPDAAPLAIAVLPFEDLSGSGEAYFAEGVSEEILNRLARNPGLKVLGRTSAASLRGEALGPAEIGRKLGVDYLVEGSVRTAGPDVRVSVALVRTADGARLWSEQYDGALKDVFSIQDRIGQAVAQRLNLKDGARPEAAIRAEGEAYSRYLKARTMLRGQEPALVEPAIALVEQLVKEQPDYASAWALAGLGYAMRSQYHQREPNRAAGRRDAVAAANRALALQPDNALAHLVLGRALGSWEARRSHLQTAARLDPNNAEIWSELSEIYIHDGDYPATLDAWRRAVAIDPLWWVAFYNAAEWAWDMGYPDEAQAYVRRVEVGGVPLPFQGHMVRGDMAWRRGDFSGQFAEAQKAWVSTDPGKRFFAELGMARSLRAVGRYDEAGRRWGHYPFDTTMLAMWKGSPPTPAQVSAFLATPEATWISRSRMLFVVSTLLSAGRHPEVVQLYDARYASPDEMEADYGPNGAFIYHGVLVAQALRATGRTADADRLLARADAAARAIDSRIPIPNWHFATLAALRAAQGKPDAAVQALQKAIESGWYYPGILSFADIGNDPAYRPLRSDPRFQRIRAAQNAMVAREAREIAALPLDPRVAAAFSIANEPN